MAHAIAVAGLQVQDSQQVKLHAVPHSAHGSCMQPPTMAICNNANDARPVEGHSAKDSGQDDMFVQAHAFRFQAATKSAKGWVGPNEGIDFVCKTFQDELFPEQEPLRLVPVYPQPQSDVTILLDAPASVTNLLMTPVLCEVHSVPPVRFADTLVGRVTEAELRAAVGALWIPGGKFYVAGSLTCVTAEDIVQLQPGMLVRLLSPQAVCRRLYALEEKLRCPKKFFAVTDSNCPDPVVGSYRAYWPVG